MHLELTRATDLAILALRVLDGADRRTKRSELAGVIGTTPDFAARVMGRLVAAGWVASEPGEAGDLPGRTARQSHRHVNADRYWRFNGGPTWI